MLTGSSDDGTGASEIKDAVLVVACTEIVVVFGVTGGGVDGVGVFDGAEVAARAEVGGRVAGTAGRVVGPGVGDHVRGEGLDGSISAARTGCRMGRREPDPR